MKLKTVFLSLAVCLAIHSCYAADTTYRKKPWFMSFSVGYTSSHAGGSLVDMVQQLDGQFGARNPYQKNGGGFAIDVLFQKQFTPVGYYKIGLGYIQKHVYPEENSYPLYKDSLNTGYLAIPFLFGFTEPLNKSRSIWFSLEGGPTGSIAIVNQTYRAPDRVDYKTLPVVLGFRGGASISFGLPKDMRLVMSYSYSVDITNAINETLYWGAPNEIYRTRSYKYQVQAFSLGFQWPLTKIAP
jgi:hypothetical protein